MTGKPRVGSALGIGASPHHDRCHQISGTGLVVIEQTQHVVLGYIETDFLAGFTQSGINRGFPVIKPPSRQGPLPLVAAQSGRSPRQQYNTIFIGAGISAIRYDHYGDRSMSEPSGRQAPAGKFSQATSQLVF